MVMSAIRKGNAPPTSRPTTTGGSIRLIALRPTVFGIGGVKCQRRQRGRTDGEALPDRSRRVSESIQTVRDPAGLGSQPAHLRDSAGVVGDRAVGVDRHRDANRSEHSDGRDPDPVQAGLSCRRPGSSRRSSGWEPRSTACPTARPEMMFVATPVWQESAIRRTGDPPVYHSVSRPITTPDRVPMKMAPKICNSSPRPLIANSAPASISTALRIVEARNAAAGLRPCRILIEATPISEAISPMLTRQDRQSHIVDLIFGGDVEDRRRRRLRRWRSSR